MKLEMLHCNISAPDEHTIRLRRVRGRGSACKPSGKFCNGAAALSKSAPDPIPFSIVNFFIERLIFASAIACGIGSVCYFLAPLAQLPNIAPPQVIVSAPYPGASAQVVADTEKTPVEQQIIGSTKVRTTLDVGYPIDIATVDVQNRVSQATPSLPAIVNRTGVARWKQNPSFALTANLTSSDGSVDPVALSNHACLQIADPLERLAGAGDAAVLAERRYPMRAWLDLDKFVKLGIAAVDVQQAIAKRKSDRTARPTVALNNATL
jgi:HAE1 family hydrophobic/amphiphilic exporter-1